MSRHILLLLWLSSLLCGAATAQTAEPLDLAKTDRGSLPLRDAIAEEQYGVNLIEPKVIGGTYATQQDNKWMAALIHATQTSDRRPFCGGSLVGSVWVATAAHCVDNRTAPTDFDILVGAADVGTDPVRIPVASILIHPDYKPAVYADRGISERKLETPPRNDIALLRLSKPAVGDDISAIQVLASVNEEKTLQPGTIVRVAGWGSTSEGDEPVRELRSVDVTIVSQRDCNDKVAYKEQVQNEMVCAGYRKGGKDACQGDSGSPLTIAVAKNYLLAGIVSWGEGCARPNRYGVYVRAARFADWIDRCSNQRPSCNAIRIDRNR